MGCFDGTIRGYEPVYRQDYQQEYNLNQGTEDLQNTLGSVFKAAGSLSYAAINALQEPLNTVSRIAASPDYQQLNANSLNLFNSMHNSWGWGGYGGWYGGWGGWHGWGGRQMWHYLDYMPSWAINRAFYVPYNYGDLPIYYSYTYPQPVAPAYNGMSGCNCGNNNAYQQPCNNGFDASRYPGYKPLDEILHPERYNSGSSINTNNNTNNTGNEQPEEQQLQEADQNGNITTPTWILEIQNKIKNGKSITPEERKLLDNYNMFLTKYSFFQIDKNNNYIEENGQKLPTNFYKKLVTLQGMIMAHDSDGIERMLKKCSNEERAALELKYATFTNRRGASLREEIKNACLSSWTGWTGYNTDQCNRIFDLLDDAAASDPRAMADAMYQAINNHRSAFGMKWGIDDSRIIKLLEKVKDNKYFLTAMLDSYSTKYGTIFNSDVNSKWYISDSAKQRINKLTNV